MRSIKVKNIYWDAVDISKETRYTKIIINYVETLEIFKVIFDFSKLNFFIVIYLIITGK